MIARKWCESEGDCLKGEKENVGGTKTIRAACLYVLNLSTYVYRITTASFTSAADEDSKKDHKMKNKKKKDEDQASDGMTVF